MSHSPRRIFLMTVALASPVAWAQAQKPPMLSETDPAAQAQGYASDAKKVDRQKWAKYQPGQQCGACQLYQGKATDAAAACPLFAGKQVAATGWCNAFVKRG